MTHAFTTTSLGRVTDENRGAAVRARREHLGMTASGLAKLAGVDRGKLRAFEDGADAPSEPWIGRVERALDGFEAETGHRPGEATEAPHSGMIKFTVEGVYGAKALVVEGPVENLAVLEDMVDRVMRRLAGDNGATPE